MPSLWTDASGSLLIDASGNLFWSAACCCVGANNCTNITVKINAKNLSLTPCAWEFTAIASGLAANQVIDSYDWTFTNSASTAVGMVAQKTFLGSTGGTAKVTVTIRDTVTTVTFQCASATIAVNCNCTSQPPTANASCVSSSSSGSCDFVFQGFGTPGFSGAPIVGSEWTVCPGVTTPGDIAFASVPLSCSGSTCANTYTVWDANGCSTSFVGATCPCGTNCGFSAPVSKFSVNFGSSSGTFNFCNPVDCATFGPVAVLLNESAASCAWSLGQFCNSGAGLSENNVRLTGSCLNSLWTYTLNVSIGYTSTGIGGTTHFSYNEYRTTIPSGSDPATSFTIPLFSQGFDPLVDCVLPTSDAIVTPIPV